MSARDHWDEQDDEATDEQEREYVRRREAEDDEQDNKQADESMALDVQWFDRVVIRENGVVEEVDYKLRTDSRTCIIRKGLTDIETFDVGFAAGWALAMRLVAG
jgi:hypothetical protein